MRFFWFDWDDPQGSIIRGAILTAMGMASLGAWWGMSVAGDLIRLLPDLVARALTGVMALGSLAVFLGLLTVALGLAAWLSAHRKRRE